MRRLQTSVPAEMIRLKVERLCTKTNISIVNKLCENITLRANITQNSELIDPRAALMALELADSSILKCAMSKWSLFAVVGAENHQERTENVEM